jgi:hypothetical protein
MGFAYDEGAGLTSLAVADEVSNEGMRRPALLAAASVALLGAPVVSQVLELPTPWPPPPAVPACCIGKAAPATLQGEPFHAVPHAAA